jgi:parallel beta-helix repeat protein
MRNSAFVFSAPYFPMPANRRLRRWGALAGVLAAGLLVGSGPARAEDIKSCPVTITKPGTYSLNQDLFCSTTGNAITISADNVTLNLKGHILLGPQTGFGVYVGAHENVVVENGTISGFWFGVWFVGTGSSQVTGISAMGAGNAGVVLSNSYDNTVSGCVLSQNHFNGLWCGDGGSTANTIANNTANGNGFAGIALDNSATQNTVQGNTADLNGGPGIFAGGTTTQNTIQGNTALGNGTDLFDGSGNCSSNTWLGNTHHTSNPSCLQ